VSKSEQLERLRALLAEKRWAALATLGREGTPEGSMVAYAMSEDGGELYLHLSELASHTRNLQQQPQASLVISENDGGHGDPQQLARASLFGRVERLSPDHPGYPGARQCYLAQLPDAEPLFGFADFHLYRMTVDKLRFVGGFGQASSFTPEALHKAAEN